MKEAGEKDIGAAVAKVTTICLKYNISQDTKKFLTRKSLLEVIKHMAQVNRDLYLQLISNDNAV
eukprot:9977994-Ditylum_brightwellii.AAC.1